MGGYYLPDPLHMNWPHSTALASREQCWMTGVPEQGEIDGGRAILPCVMESLWEEYKWK